MNTLGVAIRAARTTDLDNLATIAQQCFGAGAWRRHQFEWFQPDTGRGWTLAAIDEVSSACIGYLVMALALDEAELQALAVTPLRQHQGVGAALLTAGLATAVQRGAERVFLEVRASNVAAQRFYRRFQFLEFARRPHYYHEPDEPAVLMRWQCGSAGKSGL